MATLPRKGVKVNMRLAGVFCVYQPGRYWGAVVSACVMVADLFELARECSGRVL